MAFGNRIPELRTVLTSPKKSEALALVERVRTEIEAASTREAVTDIQNAASVQIDALFQDVSAEERRGDPGQVRAAIMRIAFARTSQIKD